ncbi:MAG TPA: hypothetical protein ENK32_12640 [Anaerolineae bacterium]|nr:hypothetical protein [Anaerolineae bacterium]
MRIAFTSRRPFNDGPLNQPIPENDQANMAYLLGADYFSFFSLKKLSTTQLAAKLQPYDLVFIPLDLRDFETVQHIAGGSNGRYILYSEGGIADYQLLNATGQAAYLQIIRHAKAIFLYWEKYVPFFQSITDKPVAYLPYPFFEEMARHYRLPLEKRANRISLPSGIASSTRNGLSSLLTARHMLRQHLISEIDCWLAPVTFSEEAAAVRHILLDEPFQVLPPVRFNWRKWLQNSRFDYRPLLNMRRKLKSGTSSESNIPTVQQGPLALLRRQNWPTYLQRLSHSLLVLDLNNRPTVGRNALDCAALGIPCISTDYSDMQPKLFPQTTLTDSWNIPTAVDLARRLLEDTSFYREVTQEAAVQLKAFLPEAFKARFAKITTDFPEILERSA